jgi:ABC-2 type transport system permease protein/lipopolysaccharide transport system permease protein
MVEKKEKNGNWLVNQFSQGLTRENLRRALYDVAEGWRRRALWGTIGLHDIRQRYRRSFLGPFWITISMGILVTALGVLYGKIFQRDLSEYMPYLAAGYIAWGFLSASILDGAKSFLGSEGLIRQLAAPLSIHVYRVLWINLIIFAHNIWIYVVLALWFQTDVGWSLLLFIPALALLLLNAMWIGLLMGLLSARFRDIPMILTSIVQVSFFITPVLWKADMLSGRAALVAFNPFAHYVEIVRAPLLGGTASLQNWTVVLLMTIAGWGLALLFYTIYRWRIAYWV